LGPSQRCAGKNWSRHRNYPSGKWLSRPSAENYGHRGICPRFDLQLLGICKRPNVGRLGSLRNDRVSSGMQIHDEKALRIRCNVVHQFSFAVVNCELSLVRPSRAALGADDGADDEDYLACDPRVPFRECKLCEKKEDQEKKLFHKRAIFQGYRSECKHNI